MNNEFLTPNDGFHIDSNFSGETPMKDPSIEAEKKANKQRLMIGIAASIFAMILSAIFVISLNASGNVGFITKFGSTAQLVMLGISTFFGLIGLFSILGLLINTNIAMKLPIAKTNEKKRKLKLSMILGALTVVSFILAILIFISASNQKSTETVVENVATENIITSPEVTSNLVAPIEIDFSLNPLAIDNNKLNIIAYKWEFGDSASATGESVSHEYSDKDEDGIYTVKLTLSVQDKNDPNAELETLNFERVISIANVETNAVINFTPASPKAKQDVLMDASDSKDPDGSIVLYEWDVFNDGIIDGEGESLSFNFEEEGEFEVKLILTDNNGLSTEKIETINVRSESSISPLILTNPADEILFPGRNYQFDASSSSSSEGSIDKFEWNFGDGKQRIGSKVNFAFETEGIYEIILKMNDSNGNELSHKKTYTVSKSPSGMFPKIITVPESQNDVLQGQVPLRVSFDAGQSGGKSITDYAWDFDNDGIIDANGQNTEHVYTDPGDYTVRLILTSSEGKTAETLLNVNALNVGLNVLVKAEPNIGQVPLTVTFDATSTIIPKGTNVVAYRWNFGDETPILREGPIVKHKYNSIGDFNVTVTAITDKNETAEGETTVFVNAIPLKACFKSSRVSGKAPLTVEFDPKCSTGNVVDFSWDFGDNNQSTDRNAKHTFETPGEYNVILEVSDGNQNLDTFTEKIVVVSE